MSDLALIWNPETGEADLAVENAALVSDAGLKTSIICCLFTDARAQRDEPLPNDNMDRRGWWGDVISPVAGWVMGSKLWLLAREKQLPSVLRRAEDYASAALKWMVDDAIASTLTVNASFPARGWLMLAITLDRPTGPTRERYDFKWDATGALLA